jgi:mono/diheme cytochrome c family protein
LLARLLAGLTLALPGVLLLPGCGSETYPEDLNYLPRTDPIVVKPPEADATLDPIGQFPYLQASYKEQGAQVIDPLDPKVATDEQREAIRKNLDDLFGTPAHPTVKLKDEEESLKQLKLDDATLARGSQLYRRHCLHCHGLTGDGHGPTGAWVNPHPRDYRLGKFKFTSSDYKSGTRKARREDLLHTLRRGIEGTSMPSFGLLSNDELEALVSYIIHLAMRGQLEVETYQNLPVLTEKTPAAIGRFMKTEKLPDVVKEWTETEKRVSTPRVPNPVDPDATDPAARQRREESIRTGYKLFVNTTPAPNLKVGGCTSCHYDFGRQNNYKYDEWGTVVRPLDLTTGIYRGGRRPIDLFWRMHSGINGTGMPAQGGRLEDESDGNLTSEELWHLVNFMQALPYPAELPEDVRRVVYPNLVVADKK